MTPEVELAIFGHQTQLFKAFSNYYTRISRETRKPKPEPITDIREALVLLYEEPNDRTRRSLITNVTLPDNQHGPAIQIAVYSSGYTRTEFTYSHLFPISTEVVNELRSNNLVSGTPEWGDTDETKLTLNERGIDRLIEECNRYE